MNSKSDSEFTLEKHMFFWLSQVLESRNRRLEKELKQFSLRVPEWRILAALSARQHLSMGELAALSCVINTTLSRTADRMVEAGWVARIADGNDLRITRLRLTDSGRKLFTHIWPTVERINLAASSGLPDAAVEMVSWVLQEMKKNLDRELDNLESGAPQSGLNTPSS